MPIPQTGSPSKYPWHAGGNYLGMGIQTGGFNPDGYSIEPRDIVIIGARDVDNTEVPLVKELGLRVYTMSELDRRGLRSVFQEAIERVVRGPMVCICPLTLMVLTPRLHLASARLYWVA